MKIGPLELTLDVLPSGSWRYTVQDTRDNTKWTCGYRPTEHGARDAGLEDAGLMRSFCH